MVLQFPALPQLNPPFYVSLPVSLTLGFDPMSSAAGEFENGPIKESTTQYRWMTDDEFLSAIESRFGKSPVIDELYLRMQRNQDAIHWIKEAEDQRETSEAENKEKLDALKEQLEETIKQIEATPKQTAIRCGVCDANLTLKF